MASASYTAGIDPLAHVRHLLDSYLGEAAGTVADRKELGRRIAKARRDKHWKQKHLAAAVSVEPATVSRWETGVHSPDLDMLDRLAVELDRPLSYFVDVPEVQPDDRPATRADIAELRGLVEALAAQVALLLAQSVPAEPRAPAKKQAASGSRPRRR